MKKQTNQNSQLTSTASGRSITKFGRGYDYEEFQTAMRSIWNSYLQLTKKERDTIVNMAKRF